MEAWVMWGLGILSNIITGALAYFIKRSIGQSDERQKSTEAEMLKRQDKMEVNLSGQIKELRAATEARIDKSEHAIEKLENRFNELVKDIPRSYVDKEAWLLQNQNVDRKLDKIMELLMMRGSEYDA